MKNIILCLSIILFIAGVNLAQTTDGVSYELVKIEAQPAKGFFYPYFLYIPNTMRTADAQKLKYTILVAPNNTGALSDDLAFHEASAKKQLNIYSKITSKVGTAILMPIFPRPKSYDLIYTHALDRDSLVTDKKEFARYDLQLVAMIDHARAKLKTEKINIDKKVFITGFSASGMFANRFAFLHPDRIKAMAAGSPGGWAIAPEEKYKEKALRYPIGIDDLKVVTGKSFDLKALRKVPLMIYMGDKDDNDSVVYRDGYEIEDQNLIFELFGKTPMERWEISRNLYQQAGLNAIFKLYPDVKHTITNEMIADLAAFFTKYKN